MGGRGCVTRCKSHEPHAPVLARAALAHSPSVRFPVSGTPRSTALHAAPRPPVPLSCIVAPASLLSPSPSLWCLCGAPLTFLPVRTEWGAPGVFRPGRGVGAEFRPWRWPLRTAPPPAEPAHPPRVLPLLSLVACTGTGRQSGFILTTVSEGPRGWTSAALGQSSADVRRERGALPIRDLCERGTHGRRSPPL